MVYGVVALVVGLALCSLAVDYGHAQYVRAQLRSCADGAARAAAGGIPTSLAEARGRARALGGWSDANGSPVTFADTDFVFGKWNATTETIDPATGTDIDAVEVTARREVTLIFGAMFDRGSADVAARATAKVKRGGIAGFIGLDGIEVKNNVFLGGYHAVPNTLPTTDSATGEGGFGTNGALVLGMNRDITGYINLGPVGTYAFADPTPNRLSTPIQAPVIPPMPKGANPNNVSHSLSINSPTTLAGGTYWFNSLRVTSTLTFAGPATVFVNGDVELEGDIRGFENLPTNLTIYVVGNKRKFGDPDANGNANTFAIAANVVAPGAEFEFKNNLHYSGAGFFKKITAKNNADFFYEQSLGDPNGKHTVQMVR